MEGKVTPEVCIKSANVWLAGVVKGIYTKEETLAVLAQSISCLQAAYTRLMFDGLYTFDVEDKIMQL